MHSANSTFTGEGEVLDSLQYLVLMVACLAMTLPLEFVPLARVYARPRRLLSARLPVVTVFAVGDVIGIVRDHWWFSTQHTSGVMLSFDMPVEELVFVIVLPICGLLTYAAVGTVLGWGGRFPGRRGRDA